MRLKGSSLSFCWRHVWPKIECRSSERQERKKRKKKITPCLLFSWSILLMAHTRHNGKQADNNWILFKQPYTTYIQLKNTTLVTSILYLYRQGYTSGTLRSQNSPGFHVCQYSKRHEQIKITNLQLVESLEEKFQGKFTRFTIERI